MTTADIDLISDYREKHLFSPNVLLLTFPNDSSTNTKQYPPSSSAKIHSHQMPKRQQTPRTTTSNVHNSRIRDSLLISPYTWLRRSERVEPISPAPDVIYRYAYLEEPKRKKSAPISRSYSLSSRASSAHSQHSQQSSVRENTSPSSSQRQYPPQFRSIYEYILYSARETDRKRNWKQEHFSQCMKRPLNDDVVLQRALSARKSSTTSKAIPISEHDLRNVQNMIDDITQSSEQINVSRPITPNELYQQEY